jgi:putative component of membrane protein insertase Oxa1/YidC/SpoIIIJ protein YidD
MTAQSIALAALTIYQGFETAKRSVLYSVFGYHSVCKHRPTCSTYTMSQIKKNGTIAGLWQGFWRVATCW